MLVLSCLARPKKSVFAASSTLTTAIEYNVIGQRTISSKGSAPVKTTKYLADLPIALIRDGKPVAPLPDFDGGLHSTLSVSSNRHRSKARQKQLKRVLPIDQPECKDDAPTIVHDINSDALNSSASKKTRPSNNLAREILANLGRFPHCILLTRVGQFYESYFEQASEVSRLLSIKLTSRKWDGQDVLMAGFPVLQLDRHLKTLIQTHQKSVAMCEEYRLEPDADKFTRRVSRIITPGTLIDESFLNHFENNYLLAIASDPDTTFLGLAWIDVSTGDFFTEKIETSALADSLARIAPREVVMREQTLSAHSNPIRDVLASTGCRVTISDEKLGIPPSDDSSASLNSASSSDEQDLSCIEGTAISLISTFLHAHLLDYMPLLSPPVIASNHDRMQIDAQTIQSLEIRESMRDRSIKGSLLGVVKRTITCSGTRLLTRWLCAPSLSLSEINSRQSIVNLFITNKHLREDIIQLLKRVDDTSRIVQKFLSNQGGSDDLLAIRTTISSCSLIKNRILQERDRMRTLNGSEDDAVWQNLHLLLSKFVDLEWLAAQIGGAIDDFDVRKKERLVEGFTYTGAENDDTSSSGVIGRPPYGSRWKIRTEFSPQLARLHADLRRLLEEKDALEEQWQVTYDAPSLTLRVSPSLGLHVHLSRARRDRTKFENVEEFVTIQQSNTTHAFFHRTWAQVGTRIANIVNDICAAEKLALNNLRIEVTNCMRTLRGNARIIDELDVTCAFAELASDMNLTRPVMVEEPVFHVTNGRHPTVELGLLQAGRVFTPNNTSLHEASRLHVITGPNMAGKSTYLRQTALVAILAQAGSFVPAEFATIGLVDKVFSRIGARDDLFSDRSTFMVEMLEASYILQRATSRSLVIMDEVGRGTTIKDGLAIAFACVNHLYGVNKCRSLFATHFHELTDMLGYGDEPGQSSYPLIEFFCNDVDEIDATKFAYSYRIRPGVNRDSHGLKVAKMAGMPDSVVAIASNVQRWLSTKREPFGTDRTDFRWLGKELKKQYVP